jgi:hypothetical protein
MSWAKQWRNLCAVVVVTFCPVHAFANSAEKLVTDGHLEISSTAFPAEGIVPGQRVSLTLEIATDRWFSGGTRISIPEVPGLVILQNEQFASNASETRRGQSWVIQRWTLDVFPQRAGEFTIPPVTVRVKVNASELGDVEGELVSGATRFSVAIPESLSQANQWVAAPAFTVKQSFNRNLDELVVGDAFEQEVLFEASDVMAMMLPGYELEQLTGLAAYPSPAVLENSNNRGQTRASRRISISYVVESPGQFLLPARDYFWWNINSGELVLVSLPETRIEIAGASTVEDKPTAHRWFTPREAIALLLGMVLFALLLRLAWMALPHLPIARLKNKMSQLYSVIQDLRKPALARRLNPGSSAGD